MTGQNKTVTIAALVLVSAFVLSIFTLRKVDAVRGKEATLEDVLYIPSGKVLKRASLGYSSLLANVYWTRAVQYFGSRHLRHSMRYDLLYPLLRGVKAWPRHKEPLSLSPVGRRHSPHVDRTFIPGRRVPPKPCPNSFSRSV